MTLQEIREKVAPICEREGVLRLDLFGSRARSNGEEGEDFDFAVELPDLPPGDYKERYFGVLFGLQDELHAPIDLLTYPSITQYSLLKRIEQDRVRLYGE